MQAHITEGIPQRAKQFIPGYLARVILREESIVKWAIKSKRKSNGVRKKQYAYPEEIGHEFQTARREIAMVWGSHH